MITLKDILVGVFCGGVLGGLAFLAVESLQDMWSGKKTLYDRSPEEEAWKEKQLHGEEGSEDLQDHSDGSGEEGPYDVG